MKLGKVVGSVVATLKDAGFEGHKLLLLQQLKPDATGNLVPARGSSEFTVSVDLIGAGNGEIVLYTSGSSARNASTRKESAQYSAVESKDSPIDAAIVGIVEQVDVDGREIA